MTDLPVTLIIPTLTRYDLLDRCVSSACEGSVRPTTILLIDNGGNMPPHIRESIARSAGRARAQVRAVVPGHNLGVAASWNLGLHQHDDWLIIANDDATFYHETIEKLIVAADTQPDELFFFPGSNGYKNAWSCFLQRRASLEVVGYYDEWISPGYGYFEDNDYSHRLQLAGYRHVPVANCAFGHVDSATLKAMAPQERETHWQRFAASKARYVAKWGGEPGQERYTIPFNGDPPAGYRRSRYD